MRFQTKIGKQLFTQLCVLVLAIAYLPMVAQKESKKVHHDPPLLFNVDQDPAERFNIAEKYPEIVSLIKERTEQHKNKMVKGPDLLKDRE
jgi:arylsulfatase A